MVVVDMFCGGVVLAMVAAFLLSLVAKWGWLEWMQVHAPNDFLSRLLNCRFCTTWWVCVLLGLIAFAVFREWWVVALPPISTMIARDRW